MSLLQKETEFSLILSMFFKHKGIYDRAVVIFFNCALSRCPCPYCPNRNLFYDCVWWPRQGAGLDRVTGKSFHYFWREGYDSFISLKKMNPKQ